MESQLYINMYGRDVRVQYRGKKVSVPLDKRSLLWGIEKVVGGLQKRKINGLSVKIEGATFSGTRQVIATVNTLAWALGIKVNGKKQMSVKYSAEPNITMPSHGK